MPCETCGANIAFEDYAPHALSHEEERRKLEDAIVATELATSREPAIIALQAVELLRQVGFGHNEVGNFDIFLAFVKQMQAFRVKTIEVVYHWTSAEKVRSIVNNNLRVPGDVNSDGSLVMCANGSAYGPGIYTAVNSEFGRCFGKGAAQVLLCLALPGNQAKIPKARALGPGEHSLKHGCLRLYRQSSQLVPLFVIDNDHELQAQGAAQVVVAFLQDR